jgi:hypothetical protein
MGNLSNYKNLFDRTVDHGVADGRKEKTMGAAGEGWGADRGVRAQLLDACLSLRGSADYGDVKGCYKLGVR